MGKGSNNTATSKQHPNAQLFARLSHLHRASSALATPDAGATAETNAVSSKLSRFYLSHLRSIAKKNVLRLDPSVKRTICKRCESLLIPGVSCRERIENQSKGGKKRWADVLVVECNACGTVKRFPVGIDEFKATKGQPKYRLASKDGEDEPQQGSESQSDKRGTNSHPANKTVGKKGGKKQQQREQQQRARIFKLPTALKGKQVALVEAKGTTITEETTKLASQTGTWK
jgi:ribonuclease P protein subunit RPR2